MTPRPSPAAAAAAYRAYAAQLEADLAEREAELAAREVEIARERVGRVVRQRRLGPGARMTSRGWSEN